MKQHEFSPRELVRSQQDEAPKQNKQQQGRSANIRQNTRNQGYQQAR